MLDKLTYSNERKEKKAFYASDVGKPLLDLYFSFLGTEQSNPPKWYETLKWGAGKGVEEAMLKVLKQNGIVDESYDQEKDGRIEIEREGVSIHGYIDAKMKDGTPIEIKSINNANIFDVRNYENGNPRENYVGQLATYMDALGVDRGFLFVSSVDGLNRFWLECNRVEGLTFKCGNVVVDLAKEYKRYAELYNNHIVKEVMPDIWEYRYKIPVDEVDWTKQSVANISKARNGHKVLGDYQIQYSPYKNLIVQLQGETLGYTPEELEKIKVKTKGFSSRK